MVNDSSNQELERWRVKGNVQKKTIPGTGSSIRQNGDKKIKKNLLLQHLTFRIRDIVNHIVEVLNILCSNYFEHVSTCHPHVAGHSFEM